MDEERQLFPRNNIEGELAIPVALNVRVLEINAAGVLLQSSRAIDPGSCGQLSLNLNGVPFKADVQVKHIAEPAGAAVDYRVGATFVSLSKELRQLLERFMAQ